MKLIRFAAPRTGKAPVLRVCRSGGVCCQLLEYSEYSAPSIDGEGTPLAGQLAQSLLWAAPPYAPDPVSNPRSNRDVDA